MAEVKQVEPLEKARLERKVPQTKLWDHFCSRCPADLVVRFESKEDVNRHLVEWLVNPDFFLLHFRLYETDSPHLRHGILTPEENDSQPAPQRSSYSPFYILSSKGSAKSVPKGAAKGAAYGEAKAYYDRGAQNYKTVIGKLSSYK